MIVDLSYINRWDTYVEKEFCYLGENQMQIQKIVNATPHTITVIAEAGVLQDPKTKQYTANALEVEVIQVFQKSGILPRVSMFNDPVALFCDIPIEFVVYGEIEGLPEEEEGVYYIVSGLVAAAGVKLGRKDLMAPGKLVRDAANSSTVLGCLMLQIQ